LPVNIQALNHFVMKSGVNPMKKAPLVHANIPPLEEVQPVVIMGKTLPDSILAFGIITPHKT